MSTIPVWMFGGLLATFFVALITSTILIIQGIQARRKAKQQRTFDEDRRKKREPKKPNLKLSYEYELRLASRYSDQKEYWAHIKIVTPVKTMYGGLEYGVRSDGIWGVIKFTLSAIGETSSGEIYLEAGDDVLEIRKHVEQLRRDIQNQEIEFEFYHSLKQPWDKLLNAINNLKVIERKADEQEKTEVR